jgi:thiamine pyrophosphate-dependent acetolactate synthase large subunit-like protein
MKFLAHLENDRPGDFTIIKARHEQAAVLMADGYARTHEDIPLCTIGRGPAIAQTGTALVTAKESGSEIFLLVPATSTSSTFDNKGFPQTEFVEMMAGNINHVATSETLPHALTDAHRTIMAGEGPAVVQVPRDILDSEIDGSSDSGSWTPFRASPTAQSASLEPDPEIVDEAVELYLDSDATVPPIILAGRGAISDESKAAIVNLAEKINAVIGTTLRARGAFDDHPYYAGFVGEYGNPLANEFVMDSGFVLALGCSLNPWTTDDGHLFPASTNLVHVDTDPKAIERYARVDLGILGGAVPTVKAFHDALVERGIDRGGTFWTERLEQKIAGQPTFDQHEFEDIEGTLDPRELIAELNELLPANRFISTDTGHHTRWVLDGLETPQARDLIWPSEFSSIGVGLPAGIGMAVDSPNKTAVTVCGEAGFLMCDNVIETASRHEIPAVVVVMNDEALGPEYHELDTQGIYTGASVIDAPSISKVAASMGATAHRVRSMEDLSELAPLLETPPSEPIVVECIINRNVKHRTKM